MHLKQDDQVIINSGKERGEKGRVIAVDRRRNRVKVERRNIIVKHQRRNPLTGDAGSRIEREGWIHASNVQLYSEKLDGPVRTSMRFVGADNELYADRQEAVESFGGKTPERISKVRYSAKTEEVFDSIA